MSSINQSMADSEFTLNASGAASRRIPLESIHTDKINQLNYQS